MRNEKNNRRTLRRTFLCGILTMLLAFAGTAGAFASTSDSVGTGLALDSRIAGAVEKAVASTKQEGNPIFVEVPVLMFHHIDPGEKSPLTPDSFRGYMEDLKEAGYETVFLDDLISFVDGKGTLPEKPVVVTFDDGYESNYIYAYPVLKEMGMKADISVIGYTVGRDTMPGTGQPITPHFTWAQAKEMYEAGVVRIHSHTYQLHQHKSTGDVTRKGVLKNPGEDFAAYVDLLRGDANQLNRMITDNLRYINKVYTYPYGLNDKLTESLLDNMGFRITITIDPGVNVIEAGNSDSLKLLKRISCDKNGLDIVELIREQSLL